MYQQQGIDFAVISPHVRQGSWLGGRCHMHAQQNYLGVLLRRPILQSLNVSSGLLSHVVSDRLNIIYRHIPVDAIYRHM